MRPSRNFVSLVLTFSCLFLSTQTVGAGPPPKVELCHVPPGDASDAHTVRVSEKAAQSHLNNHADDYLGPCVSGCQGEGDCEDGDLCTDDICLEDGTCDNPPVGATHCTDGNPCTTDSCDPALGCVNTAEVGLGCDDSNDCTNGDACDAEGACAGTSIAGCCLWDFECDDDDPCSVDTCQSLSCVNTPVDCDDGDPCTVNVCVAGDCESAAASCDDANVCTDDACDSATGCVSTNNLTSCDDGDACTDQDVCSDGTCSGTSTLDCAGVCNGASVIGSDGGCCLPDALDCANVCDGTSVTDPNAVCCLPAALDCAGICDGLSTSDGAGGCCLPTAKDCAGICNGTAVLDCAGVCDGASVTGSQDECCLPAALDCAGVCDGFAIIGELGGCCLPEEVDACGVCNGDGTGTIGCANNCNDSGTCVCDECECPEQSFGELCECTELAGAYNGFFQHSFMEPTPLTGMPAGGALSAEVWVFPTKPDVGLPVFTRLGATGQLWTLSIGASGSSSAPNFLRLGNSDVCETCLVTGNSLIPLNTWTHVAFTWDGTVDPPIGTLYVNGVPDGSGPYVPNPDSSGQFLIGNSASSFFGGRIDDVRMWSTVRTPAQIAANWEKSLLGTGEPTLVFNHNYQLWRGGDGSCVDYSDNGLDLFHSLFVAKSIHTAPAPPAVASDICPENCNGIGICSCGVCTCLFGSDFTYNCGEGGSEL